MSKPQQPRWSLQVRIAGARYETVQSSDAMFVPRWNAHEWIWFGSPYSVRIIDQSGRVVMRSTPASRDRAREQSK